MTEARLTLFARITTIADRLGTLGYTLPAASGTEYPGTVVDAAGEEILVVDQHGERPDGEAVTIAELLAAAINAGQHARAPDSGKGGA